MKGTNCFDPPIANYRAHFSTKDLDAKNLDIAGSWLAKAYAPTDSLIHEVKRIYRVALRLHSWGLYVRILSKPPAQGGFGFAPPDVFLWHQVAHPCIKVVVQPKMYADSVMQNFGFWASKIGFSQEYRHLPSTQLGMVRTNGLSFLAWCAKSFSLVRRRVPPVQPPKDLQEVPLWRSVFFGNTHGHTYYCTTLI